MLKVDEIGLKLNPAQKWLLSGFIDTYLRLHKRESKEFDEVLTQEPISERKEIMELTSSWK
jgi:hypothetical protein